MMDKLVFKKRRKGFKNDDRLSIGALSKLYFLILSCFITTSVYSQDNQYWTQQFGVRSALMAGAVVGGCNDNSAVYYNPARLAYIKEAAISIHADLFKFQNLALQNGAGTGNDINSANYYTYPTAITGLLDFKNKKWKGGYMFMMKQNSEFEVSYDKESDLPNTFFTNYNEPYNYVTGFSRKSKLEDIGVGMALAYQFSDHFSMGFTQFFNYRNTNYYFNTYGRVVGDTSRQIATNTETQDVSYANFRTHTKIGIAFQTGRIKIGVAATLPSINLGGKGEITREQLWTTDFVKDTTNGGNAGLIAYDKQEKLATTYKTPLSVSIGLEYHSEKTIVALVGEWFATVARYNIMSPLIRTPVLPRSVNTYLDSGYMTLYAHNNSVINLGVALQQQVSRQLALHLGFATDMNYAKDDKFLNYSALNNQVGKIIINQSSWDIFHHTVGISYKKKHSTITFGADYQLGSAPNQLQWVNMNTPNHADSLFGTQLADNNIHYSSINFMIGFTHFIHHETETEKKE
ncbi:MAG: outer membrane protein transport protein [Bacteroidetes bacterium]|nr:outer membrane protein transport protein [Bacteroidota bacterium]